MKLILLILILFPICVISQKIASNNDLTQVSEPPLLEQLNENKTLIQLKLMAWPVSTFLYPINSPFNSIQLGTDIKIYPNWYFSFDYHFSRYNTTRGFLDRDVYMVGIKKDITSKKKYVFSAGLNYFHQQGTVFRNNVEQRMDGLSLITEHRIKILDFFSAFLDVGPYTGHSIKTTNNIKEYEGRFLFLYIQIGVSFDIKTTKQ
jgi:hypothetical protein